MNGLHIAIDALFRLPEGGGRTYLEQILTAWRNSATDTGDRITVFTTPKGADVLRPLAGQAVTFHIHKRPGQGVIQRVVWEQFVLPRKLRQIKPDVLLCPGNMIPLMADVPIVLTLQTGLLRPTASYCPDAPLRARLLSRIAHSSAKRAARVICISDTLREIVIKRFGIDAERAIVIHYGVTPMDNAQPTDVSTVDYSFSYILCIAALQRYKRQAELISGYAQFLQMWPACDWRLILVGHPHDRRYAAELHAQIERLQLQERVIFTGGVSHPMVKALLRHATAVVNPSACESFGLPLLEAMTAGVPIACSSIPASREVVGDAALLFDPDDPAAIAAQLIRLADPTVRTGLIECGRARLSAFGTWADTAAQTRDVLLAVADEVAQTKNIHS